MHSLSTTCPRCGKPVTNPRKTYCSMECFRAGGRRRTKTVEERFWEKVQKSDGCWLWTAGSDSNGYGMMALRIEGATIYVRAHVMSWKLNVGPVPEGTEICHTCDNPPCVRPDHLFLGTTSANVRDMLMKGRGKNAKLTVPQAVSVKRRLAAGESPAAVAEAFGISREQAFDIKAGRSWGWLT